MVDLRGYIVAETSKAILFHVTEDIHLHLNGKRKWFPKSKIKLPKRRSDICRIYVQNWLYESSIPFPEIGRM